MTNEQNFKKGDNVRYIGKYPCYVRTDISKDETYTVREIDGDMCLVDVPTEGAIHVCNLELVESLDRRTAFLTRLQSLMREFDAEICYCEGDCELYIDLGNGHRFDRIIYPLEYVGYDIGDEGRLNLDADNIMDFHCG